MIMKCNSFKVKVKQLEKIFRRINCFSALEKNVITICNKGSGGKLIVIGHLYYKAD